MRSRFFGASSFDEPGDEESPMDMSGFIGSTTVEQQPIVVERKRAIREGPAQTLPFSGGDSGVGNAGPRSVPPPQPQMRNIGYAPSVVMNAANNSGSPFNPLWASDASYGPTWLPVVSKTTGLVTIVGAALVARGIDWGPKTKVMAATGLLLYAHPVLGINQGLLGSPLAGKHWIIKFGAGAVAHGVPLVGYNFFRKYANR